MKVIAIQTYVTLCWLCTCVKTEKTGKTLREVQVLYTDQENLHYLIVSISLIVKVPQPKTLDLHKKNSKTVSPQKDLLGPSLIN